MEKTVYICRLTIALLLFLTVGSTVCMAEGIKDKAIKKACNQMCKQLKKEGWKVFDATSTDLATAVQGFYEALEAGGDSVRPLSATGMAGNVNLAKSKAKTHAAQDYASQLHSEVQSITDIKVQNTQEGAGTSSQKEVESNLSVKVEQLVKGMSPALTLRREHDGKTEVQMLYIVKHINLTNADE